MRVVAALVALMLLAGCEAAPSNKAGDAPRSDSFDYRSTDAIESFTNPGNGFDYRYAFRVPGNRLKAVLQSNADGCERMGPTRCRILGMRYAVDQNNHIRAVLTIKIDPSVARNFGDAVTNAVTSGGGVLIDTQIAGADTTATARSVAVINRLREQLRGARAQAASGGADATTASARAERYQAALDAIAESESSQGETLATAPLLLTYESSSPLTGPSADANFRAAGQTLETTLAQLAKVAAAFGPWLIAVIVLVFLLRLVVHGRAVPEPEGSPNAVPVPPHADQRRDNRNLIQRWFARDDDDEDEPRS